MFAADAVYTYLARVIDGEPAAQTFPPGESVILPPLVLQPDPCPGHIQESGEGGRAA
jgi:hypothetical protein